MPLEERKQFFFLKANDDLFRPEVNPVGSKLEMNLIDYNTQESI